MNSDNLKLASDLVSRSYVQQGSQALAKRQNLIKALLSNRKLPKTGWDDSTIEMFIRDVALMDTNNFVGNIGAGEREGRVASSLVARRHYGLSHGIGRSGDISAEQPKAAGSSLLYKVATFLVKDALRIAGLKEVSSVTLLPCATGMALTQSLLALKASRPPSARYVLWPRLDQKTCLKAIVTAGCEPVPMQLLQHGDELRTNLPLVQAEIKRLGAENIVCVMSSTSCFAPRGTDHVVEVAVVCSLLGIPHLVNNAYGVQSCMLCNLLSNAMRKGRVDGIVQSTDKNFMVPVGGAILAEGSRNNGLVKAVNEAYPGRAGIGPALDVLMTLLGWGADGWKNVLLQREDVYKYARTRLAELASKHRERVLDTPNNPISLAMTLCTLGSYPSPPSPARHPAGGETQPAPPRSSAASPDPRAMEARRNLRRTSCSGALGRGPEDGPDSGTPTRESAHRVQSAMSHSAPTSPPGLSPAGSSMDYVPSAFETAVEQTILGSLTSPNLSPRLQATQCDSCLAGGTSTTRPDVPASHPKAVPQRADMHQGGLGWPPAAKGESEIPPAGSPQVPLAGKLPAGHSLEASPPGQSPGGAPTAAAGADTRAGQASKETEPGPAGKLASEYPVTFLGSMLFSRGVSGARVVAPGKVAQVAGFTFNSYGAHSDHYPVPYVNMAAAVGMTRGEVDSFISRLDHCMSQLKGKGHPSLSGEPSM